MRYYCTALSSLLFGLALPLTAQLSSSILLMGWPEMVGVLLGHGAQVNARDHFGSTPLLEIVRSRYADEPAVATIITFVQEGGARPLCHPKRPDGTPG